MKRLLDCPSRLHRKCLAAGLLAGSILCVAVLAGCGKHGTAGPGGSDTPPSKMNLKRNVMLGRADQRSMIYSVETVGVLEAESMTDIAAGVSGVVDEVLFREGDVVGEKTVLVKVDQKRYLTALRVAEANEQRAAAGLRLARDMSGRMERAGAGASAEEKTRATLNLGLAEAEAEAAKAARDLALHNVDRSQVRAPYKGRINQKRVTPGVYLEDKTTIATMANLSRIRLVGWVPETAAPTMRKLFAEQDERREVAGLTLPLGGFLAHETPWAGLASLALLHKEEAPSGFDPEFTLRSMPGRNFRARIFYLSTVAEPTTHMFECKAEVRTDGLGDELRPGYFARIRLPLMTNPNACVIAEEAIRATERGFIAFVPEQRKGKDGKPEWVAKARTLELGYRSPGWVEVRQGILPGEWIVRKGAEALEDGTPIQFEPPPGFDRP